METNTECHKSVSHSAVRSHYTGAQVLLWLPVAFEQSCWS